MLEDLRTCRATTFLGISWIVVFLAMHLVQGAMPQGAPPLGQRLLGFGQVEVQTAHQFGALRWSDVLHGEVWRLVTATFIHFNAMHLIMNLIGLMQLGWLMEPWYGSRQYLAICLTLGGLGNLFGGLLRQVFYQIRGLIEARGLGRMLPEFLRNGGVPGLAAPITSGGGSTIILGLIGLGVVVGWRSRTRVGAFMRDQMLGFLVFTAMLGMILAKLVDNYGHAGGTIAGLLVGFAHRKLVHTPEKGWFRKLAGVAAVALLVVCAVAQARDARQVSRDHREQIETLAEAERVRRHGQATLDLLVKLEALGRAIDRLALLRQPLGIPEVDWPEPLGKPAPIPPSLDANQLAERVQARKALVTALTAVQKLRVELETDLNGEELRQLMELAAEAGIQPLSSRHYYSLKLLAETIVRRALADRERLATRFDELVHKAERLTGK